jgi:phosphoglycolate phosphatase
VTPAAVLFDLDGVLIDSRAAITNCIRFGLRAVGAPERSRDELAPWIGPPLIHAFTELAGPEHAQEALDAYRSRYVTSSLDETLPVPGMDAALARIAAAVPTALATSKPRAFALPLCDRLGLTPHLRVIEGPDLAAIAETKAQTVARALAGLGLAPGAAAVMIGDRRHDVEGARANGLPCIGVLWGIGDRAELESAGAAAIVETPAELPAAVGVYSSRST